MQQQDIGFYKDSITGGDFYVSSKKSLHETGLNHEDYLRLRNYSGGSCNSDEVAEVCCTPKICLHRGDKVIHREGLKVQCSYELCTQSGWMHHDCFDAWEDDILDHLKTSWGARNWNEKQRAQNVWTKKGHDLVLKMCKCLCGHGFLRKDLDHVLNLAETDAQEEKRKHHPIDKPLPTLITDDIPQARQRTMSMSSTGSSPPPSASPTGSLDHRDCPFEFTLTAEQAAAGNIFYHRQDLQAFNRLPPQKRNPYHIKMEDEGPYGNDETRSFVLSTLSTKRVVNVPCVVCGTDLNVYDKYPLVDGTLFVTPQRYISDISLMVHGQPHYLNAVCMMCAEATFTQLRCKQCHRLWDGGALQIGTMYSYDVFAANPCCRRRLACKNCQHLVMEPSSNTPYSHFSHAQTCQHCCVTSFHFVKPLNEIFSITRANFRH